MTLAHPDTVSTLVLKKLAIWLDARRGGDPAACRPATAATASEATGLAADAADALDLPDGLAEQALGRWLALERFLQAHPDLAPELLNYDGTLAPIGLQLAATAPPDPRDGLQRAALERELARLA